MTVKTRYVWHQWMATAIAFVLIAPFFAVAPAANAQLFGKQNPNAPRKPGMSTGQKVLLVGGAALLYYLYKKHQASVAAKSPAIGNPNVAANGQTPQLYRSKNGGVYYRDAQHRPVWLTVPSQPVQVPAADLQRYAPDYNSYRGPAPSAPAGYRTQQFEDFDSRSYGGSALPPGPRRGY